MAAVEVFVDDAVRGRLPHVSAKTGAPADGKLRVEQARGGLGAAWLLVFLGPLGWLVLVAISFSGGARREVLTVRLPYSEAAVDHDVRLSRERLGAVSGAIGFALLAVVSRSVPVFSDAFGLVAVCAVFVAVVMHFRLAWERVGIKLDTSRRWITLSGVHRDFVHAVAEKEATARPGSRGLRPEPRS